VNKRVYLHRFLLALVSTLIALAVAEAACRILIPSQPTIRLKECVDELEGLRLHAAVDFMKNDTELFWRLAPNTTLPATAWPFFGIIANGQSLREDHEIAQEKPDGELRILFLGDSCTFGYGVAADEAFPAVVESLLREQEIADTVECINAGVPGYSLFQGYRYLVTEGLRYKPDLVVLNFGWNDYSRWDGRGDLEHYELLKAARPPPPLNYSHICQLIWSHRFSPPPVANTPEPRPRLRTEEFVEILEEVSSVAQNRRIPLLILVWPMRENTNPVIPDGLRSLLQMEMIASGLARPVSMTPRVNGVLDLIPLGRRLVREHGEEAIYFDHGHVTSMAHQAIGEAIAEHLKPCFSAGDSSARTSH